jgi:hypothetical protein
VQEQTHTSTPPGGLHKTAARAGISAGITLLLAACGGGGGGGGWRRHRHLPAARGRHRPRLGGDQPARENGQPHGRPVQGQPAGQLPGQRRAAGGGHAQVRHRRALPRIPHRRRQERGHQRHRRGDGAHRLRRGLRRPAAGGALRARHHGRAQLQPGQVDRQHAGRRRRRPAGGGHLRGAGLHRGGAQLRGLRQVDAAVPPLPERRPAGQGHGRCAHRGAQDLPEHRRERRRLAVHHRLFAGRLRGHGGAPRDAGHGQDGDGLGAAVGALGHQPADRLHLPGLAGAGRHAVRAAAVHQLAAAVRQRVRQHRRHLRVAVRQRHRHPAAEP